jgi:peptide/nickel transport system permease protein
MSRYLSDTKTISGIIMVSCAFLCMAAGLFFLPYNPDTIDIPHKLQFISFAHPFGTDNLGRDLLSRIMTGYRISFFIGIAASCFGLLAGGAIGMFGGYFGGKTDAVVGKLIDIQMAFPGILLALMLAAIAGTGMHTTVFSLCIMSIPRFARVIRSGFIRYRDSFLVMSARSRGASALRIMIHHILPNIRNDILTTFSISFAYAIMNETGLSYLGLGIQPPSPSFGRMLNDAQNYIMTSPWFILFPAIAVAIPVAGMMLIGDGISSLKNGA